MKQVIRLTESDLHRMIKESVKKVLSEEFTFNDVDPNGGVDYSEADETIYDIENGYYDEDIKHMNVKELDDWVDDMHDISTRVGETAIKRATMVNKQYAMSNKRENMGRNSLHYNDYRSSNFYKGAVSQANAVGKTTPFGMEDLETRWKYGEQKHNRPNVNDVVNYPLTPTKRKYDLDRLFNHSYKVVNDDNYRDEIERGYNDWKIKHDYNGRNPNTQKLHTKGSANRDLIAMDKAKKH